MTQERRRYGFVLERQCSLAKHWIAYHTSGKNCLSSHLDSWDEVSSSREFLPPNVENMFAKNIKVSKTKGVYQIICSVRQTDDHKLPTNRINTLMMSLTVVQSYRKFVRRRALMHPAWICAHWAMW